MRFLTLAFCSLLLYSCSESQETVKACDNNLTIKAGLIADAVANDPIGRIVAEANGGAIPYVYSLNNGEYTSTPEFKELRAGSYLIKVQDKNGCEASTNVIVNEQMIVSYDTQIKPILIANCMIEGCHCTGNPLCFSTYEEVADKAEGIKNRTTNRAMPPIYSGKSLTDNEIKDIANWVYQGMKNN